MLVSSWGVIDPILGAEEVSNSEMSKGTDKKKKKVNRILLLQMNDQPIEPENF
jgi:hypothetical protein